MIFLDRLSRFYGKILAVSDLTLKVGEGEILGFLGVNGAGKTTTIKIMTGLLSPSGGAVFFNGEEVCPSNPEVRRLFGYVPDQPILLPRLTALESIRFSAELYGIELKDKDATTILETQELASQRDQIVHTFSRGMKQRLGIAMALAHKPKILILDEPLVGLDPTGIVRLKEVIKSMAKEGACIFMSTHTLSFAEEVATRVVIIDHGKLCADGPPSAIRSTAKDSANLTSAFFELTASP